MPAAPASSTFAAPSPDHPFGKPAGGWRLAFYCVIFESDTAAGRMFDKLLIALILLSVGVVMADSVQAIHLRHHRLFGIAEWCFTVVFTLEYLARLACVRDPWRYVRSFFGMVDLLALLPTYLALVFPEVHALVDVRILRLLRIFRIFKLAAYVAEFQALGHALYASRRKILVFLSAVLMIVLVVGTLMYVVEGPEHGFTSIPTAIYWAITTMTTVGFGDITPRTDIGRLILSVMMLLGWGTLAVPTGIVTAEFTARRVRLEPPGRSCEACGALGHAADAGYCMQCGAALPAAVPGPGPR